MLRSTLFFVLALALQQTAARITPTRVDEEIGQAAVENAFMKFEAADEDKLFFDRALAGSMSMSMAMSVDGASGTSAGAEDQPGALAVFADDKEPAMEVEAELENGNTVTATDSSASKAAFGISCIVGAVGALLL